MHFKISHREIFRAPSVSEVSVQVQRMIATIVFLCFVIIPLIEAFEFELDLRKYGLNI